MDQDSPIHLETEDDDDDDVEIDKLLKHALTPTRIAPRSSPSSAVSPRSAQLPTSLIGKAFHVILFLCFYRFLTILLALVPKTGREAPSTSAKTPLTVTPINLLIGKQLN